MPVRGEELHRTTGAVPELSKEIVVRRRYMYGDKFLDTQMKLYCKQRKVKRMLENWMS